MAKAKTLKPCAPASRPGRRNNLRRLTRLLLLLTLALTLTIGNGNQPTRAAEAGPGQMEPHLWVARAYFSDPAMLAEMVRFTEPWEVHKAAGYALVGVDDLGLEKLKLLGFRVEIDPQLTVQANTTPRRLAGQASGIPGYPCYRTVEETYASAQALAQAAPNLATWSEVGKSWNWQASGGAQGYGLYVLKLTDSAIPGPKPKLFIMAAIHARELTTAETAMRFAESLVQGYGSNADITWLLDYNEIHLLLQTNPDGRKLAEAGNSWRKNTDNAYCTSNPSLRGADLNRNFSFQWNCCGGSSSNSCDEVYHGSQAASEPETQAVEGYLRNNFPDLRGPGLNDPAQQPASGVLIDLHSYSQLVLWPWGFTSALAPDAQALKILGHKLAFFNAYTPQQAYDLYITDGTSDDFAYGELGIAAYTIEMGASFFESCPSYLNSTLPANLPALLYAAKVARAPYRLPAGPDVVAPTATPASIFQGFPASLSAQANAVRYEFSNQVPTQPIAGAFFTIDTPPWITSTVPITYPMAAADGLFNQKIENLAATLDTSSLAPGRHTLFFQARDQAGNAGAVSAIFIDVVPAQPPVFLPLIAR